MKLRQGLLTIAASLAFAGAAHADGVCIDEKARQALACTGARTVAPANVGKAPGFHAPLAAKPRPNAGKPGTPLVDGAPRDPRTIRLQARVRKILVDEVLKLESLLGTTPRNAPDRLAISRRLADDYVELESAGLRDKTIADAQRDPVTAAEADRITKSARKRAIDLYASIAADYPTHGQIDDVLYYLAYEYEQAGEAKGARAAYYDLIKKAPSSRHVPSAYLAFGEAFFFEAQGDPSKWDIAAQAYAEVVKYPAPQNVHVGYAHYKTAYVYWNKGELDKALDAFKKTIDFGVANPTLAGATRLAESARRDTIPVYALKGDPKLAFVFFRSVAGGNDRTYAMLDDLGHAYADTGHYPEAIIVYKDLLARDRGPRSCLYQAGITEAVMAMRSGDKDGIRSELDALFKTVPAGAPACGNRVAAIAIETAMSWHLEAVGSNGQRGTNERKTMALAAGLYQRTLDTWSAKELAAFEYPRLVKEDWPTSFKIKYAMADLLYETKDWARCGPAFDAVLAEDPNGAEAAKAAYAAGLCYQAAFEAARKAKTTSPEQTAMLRAFDRYLCTIKPAADDAAGQAQLVEVAFARGRTYFEARRWEEAAAAFRTIAFEHPHRDSAMFAAQLYLESAGMTGKPACQEAMIADIPRLATLHCAGDQDRSEACASLHQAEANLVRQRAEQLVATADKMSATDPGAAALYARAGNAYYELFRSRCRDAPVRAERCDELAHNAAKAFQAGRLLAKSIAVRRELVAFEPRSPLAKRAMYEVGSSYQAIALYEPAAEWFERYARESPRAGDADRALGDAVVLRLGLGQEPEAIKDADEFVRTYGATKPALAGGIAYAIAAHHAEKGEWDDVRAALTSRAGRGAIERAPLDVQMQAHVTLGRALLRLGPVHATDARGELAAVARLWANPAAGEARILGAYPSEDAATRARRVGRAVEAAGEALFLGAEARRAAEVDPIRFPEYVGAGDLASVKAHVDGPVKRWYERKMAAIVKVEGEYAKVLALKPQAPPRWVIAAGARAGLLWGDFVDDFRRAPYPRAWRNTQLEQVYTTKLDLASEPYKRDHARPALEHCLRLATEFQFFDGFSRSCEVWLAKNYKDQFHVVDELRSAPTLASSGLAEKPPPLLADTTFFHGRH